MPIFLQSTIIYNSAWISGLKVTIFWTKVHDFSINKFMAPCSNYVKSELNYSFFKLLIYIIFNLRLIEIYPFTDKVWSASKRKFHGIQLI